MVYNFHRDPGYKHKLLKGLTLKLAAFSHIMAVIGRMDFGRPVAQGMIIRSGSHDSVRRVGLWSYQEERKIANL